MSLYEKVQILKWVTISLLLYHLYLEWPRD
jgi:hypothetical protein